MPILLVKSTLFFFTYVVCLLLAYCFCSSGGKCLSAEYTEKVGEIAKSHGLKLHIDGARIFNASVVSSTVSLLGLKISILYRIEILCLYTLPLRLEIPRHLRMLPSIVIHYFRCARHLEFLWTDL
jgi:hypothetical protein